MQTQLTAGTLTVTRAKALIVPTATFVVGVLLVVLLAVATGWGSTSREPARATARVSSASVAQPDQKLDCRPGHPC